jgi:UDP-GlcNAc:undecaprenyl-phosphate GlcNAc-1-phosphate transferase
MAGIELLSLGAILSSNDVQLGLFSTIFTIFAVIGVINSLNFSDGIDGMAASISIVAFSSIAFLIHNVQEDMFKLSIFLIIASLVFLVFNLGIFRTKLYKIFLGDAGSTYLGLAIAWLLISLSQGDNIKFSPVVALWIYSVPLMDTVSIMLRRVSNRKSPFLPDREHLHHLFLRAGYSDRQSLLIIFVLSLLLSFVGILLHQNAVSERIMFFLFMMVFLIYYVLIKHSWKTMRFIKVK